jgi:hypothetical protein
MVRHVGYILNDCHTSLNNVNIIDKEAAAAAKTLGSKTSLKWQFFTIQVIEHLHKKGAFYNEDGTIDTFEDTAGGNDERVWAAALTIIETEHSLTVTYP